MSQVVPGTKPFISVNGILFLKVSMSNNMVSSIYIINYIFINDRLKANHYITKSSYLFRGHMRACQICDGNFVPPKQILSLFFLCLQMGSRSFSLSTFVNFASSVCLTDSQYHLSKYQEILIKCLGMLEFGRVVIWLLDDNLEISTNLYGEDYRAKGKFLEHHYGGYFLSIFSLLAHQIF